jgi:hypothetical protein
MFMNVCNELKYSWQACLGGNTNLLQTFLNYRRKKFLTFGRATKSAIDVSYTCKLHITFATGLALLTIEQNNLGCFCFKDFSG